MAVYFDTHHSNHWADSLHVSYCIFRRVVITAKSLLHIFVAGYAPTQLTRSTVGPRRHILGMYIIGILKHHLCGFLALKMTLSSSDH